VTLVGLPNASLKPPSSSESSSSAQSFVFRGVDVEGIDMMGASEKGQWCTDVWSLMGHEAEVTSRTNQAFWPKELSILVDQAMYVIRGYADRQVVMSCRSSLRMTKTQGEIKQFKTQSYEDYKYKELLDPISNINIKFGFTEPNHSFF